MENNKKNNRKQWKYMYLQFNHTYDRFMPWSTGTNIVRTFRESNLISQYTGKIPDQPMMSLYYVYCIVSVLDL